VQLTCRYNDYNAGMPAIDTALLASDLRVVLGQLIRRLRAEHRFPISQGTVLGRLDREGASSVSDLAVAERVRPQSMAQTVADLEADGLVSRRPDPDDKRRALVELTEHGRSALYDDRRQREGWLAQTIDDFSAEEQAVLREAAGLLRRLAES
jgi:DNA-binding MarR family transcriptional regulator